MTATMRDAIVADACFPTLRDHIIAVTGLVFYADRPQVLAGHVADRLKKRGISGCGEYWELLHDGQAGEAEFDQLIELLTIGETYFFRHRELFDAIRDVALPDLIERNRPTQRLRVWSAGCSTGPEAYSVSVLLRRDLESSIRDWNLSILGTDINRPFLSQASEGRYEEWAFRGTSPEFRRECFDEQDDSWRITPRFKRGVSFQYHNLARHPFPSLVHNLLAFDLILCRNVLIYFAPDIVERIISQLADCLVPGGWLAVGHAEHGPHLRGTLETVNCAGATLYRKSGTCTAQATIRDSAQPFGIARPSVAIPPVSHIGFTTMNRAARDGGPHIPSLVGPPPAAPKCKSGLSTPCPEIERVRALADEGAVDAALNLCETLISKESLNPVHHFYQALLLDQVAGHDAALHALCKAIYLDREFVLAHYYSGLIQHKLANVVGASKSFRNVLRLVEGRDPAERLSDAEGMTIADLDELTRMHLETLETS
ncbi:MAG TPA: CheR family methyltransferase [Lacipirellulaceae bacterium]